MVCWHYLGSYAQHAIPVSLKPLKNLEYLLLDRVAMTGNIAELLELNNLKEFTLTNGELTGTMRVALSHTTHSKSTCQQPCHFLLAVIPPVVFKMKALTSLDLGNNKISGPIPASISALTSLKTLQLSYNQLTSGLEHLAVLPELANLHLGVNKFSGTYNYCRNTSRCLYNFCSMCCRFHSIRTRAAAQAEVPGLD